MYNFTTLIFSKTCEQVSFFVICKKGEFDLHDN